MASTDNMTGKIIAWETGCQRRLGEGIEAYYNRAKEYNRVKTNGTYTIAGDKGGVTVVGVTIKTYETYLTANRSYKSHADSLERIKAMNYNEWYNVLAGRLIAPWKAERIDNRSIMELCVDFGWLCGVSTAVKKVQGAFMITADGVVGSKTLTKLNAQPSEGVHERIKKAYMAHIENIVRNNPAQKKFRNGWLNRINSYKFAL